VISTNHILAVCLCLVLSIQTARAEFIFHIAPNGSSNAILADIIKNTNATVTLERALNLLKSPELRDATGAPKENITLKIESGTYRLTETIKLDTTSSGSAKHPVTLQGPQDGSAIITGGRTVNGFTQVNDPAMLARIPAVAHSHVLQANLTNLGITNYGKFAGHGLGANNVPTALDVMYKNQPMTIARWPNQGFAKIASTPDGEKGLTFTVQGANIASWEGEPNLLATGYWFQNWADETISIKSINTATQQLTLSKLHYYGLKAGQRIFFQNALAELDQPGEWYFNTANGILYFWPPEFPKENEVEVSILEKLLIIDNTSHVHINNLTFQSARGDAITVRGGHHVSIANSIIRNIGNHAAVISGRDNGLTDMLIEDIGEGAIVLQGGDRQTLKPANLYVEGSTMRRFARVTRTYQPAVLMSGVGNRAVGNKISDAPHTAILFTGNDHLISHNEIFDVCKETGDAGVIYTGRDWTARGTLIAENHIHDIPPNIEWGRTKAIYLDDQASGIIVRGNQLDKVDEAVFIGGGRDNLVEDNKFIDTATAIHLDARGKAWQKTTTDDPNGTLRKRLAEVPYNKTPYKERYPHLANILEDEPGMPKYNIARNNLLIGNLALAISKDAEAGISIERLNQKDSHNDDQPRY
jgi:hypothetical protein